MSQFIRVSGYRLKTGLLDFGTYRELGFQGDVSYEIDARAPDELVKTIQALGDFAFFSGVGAKTTMGMGQARRMSHARSIPG
jgi:CRISPR-associated endoribonuclease Cas6